VRDLLEAIDGGFITKEYVAEHVARGWVRPSLLYQIEHRVEDGLLLPRAACALDEGFVAPYEKLPGFAAAVAARGARRFVPWLRAKRLLRATLGHFRRRAVVRRLEQRLR
jgi:hypothetical protein